MNIARIGAFELDVAAGELRRSGRLVALTGQPIRVLIMLVQRAGTIVTRDELRREIWGETHVDFEAGLSTCVNQIRTALGDRAAAPHFIETLTRRGYRFIGPVEWLDAQPAPTPRFKLSRRAAAAIILVASLTAVAIASISTARGRTPVSLVVLPVVVDPARSELDPVSRTLTDALVGALTSEAGDQARVLSPLALRDIQEPTIAGVQKSGIDYIVYVTLRSLGGPVLVHVKLIGPGGWTTWTSDRTMTVDELERAPLRLAEELSKPLLARSRRPS
jgi:DNA-binding winged helix-turn-helix (wHTH) protein